MTMTDYIEPQIIEEQDEFVSESDLMSRFMGVQAALSQADCYCEFAEIAAFCGNDIQVPSIIQEGEVTEFFERLWDNICDWVRGIINSITQMFNKNMIRKFIKVVEPMKSEDFKMDINKDLKFNFVAMEYYYTILDNLAITLNEISDGALDDDDKREYILSFLGELKKSTVEKCEDVKSPETGDSIKAERDTREKMMTPKTKDELLDALRKLVDLDLPASGRGILNRLKFNKKEIMRKKEVDKEVVRAFRKFTNTMAVSYDVIFRNITQALVAIEKRNGFSIYSSEYAQTKGYKTSSGSKYDKNDFRDQTKPVGKISKPQPETKKK